MSDNLRLLHKSSQYGYTEHPFTAMADDPGEAVPPDYQSKLTADSRVRNAERHELDAEQLTKRIVDEIRQGSAAARKRGKSAPLKAELAKLQPHIAAIRDLAA